MEGSTYRSQGGGSVLYHFCAPFKMTGTLRGLNSAQADGMRSHGGKKKKEKTDAEVSAEEVESNFSVQRKPPA